jgi:hypothetical protein
MRPMHLLRAALARMQLEEIARRDAALHYCGPADFVLHEGRIWTPSSLAVPFAPGVRCGAPSMCFGNAIFASFIHGLRYVEGFAWAGPGVGAVHHAWCVDEARRVLDFTWADEEVLPLSSRAYIGVVFSIAQAHHSTWDHDATVLDDPAHGHPLLRAPFVHDEHPDRPTIEQFEAWNAEAMAWTASR